jgi:uncharacterized membrane protein
MRSAFTRYKIGTMLFWALVVVVMAGATHIVSILLMPRIAPKNAFRLFAAHIAPHHLTLLTAGQSDPTPRAFADPAMVQAVCVFDVREGVVRLRGPVASDQLTTMSFHSSKGDVFYSLTDRSALQGRFDIVLLNSAQLDAAEARDNEDEVVQEHRILVPTPEGFVIVQTLMERPAERPQAEARLAALNCTQEPSH